MLLYFCTIHSRHEKTNEQTNGRQTDKFKIAVLMYRVLQGAAPQYLRQFVRVADVPSRQRLWSAVTDRQIVPVSRLSTIGCRSFYVAGANILNSLPRDITSSSSLSVFKQRLKT
jgi:hypothetical protein